MGALVEILVKVLALCSYLVRGMQVVMCVCVYVACFLLSTISPMSLAIEAVRSESIASGLHPLQFRHKEMFLTLSPVVAEVVCDA